MSQYKENFSRQDYFQAFAHHTDDVFIALTADLTITIFNPAAERLFSCANTDAIGKKYNDFFISLHYTSPVPSILFDSNSNESSFEYDGSIIKKHDKERFFRWKIIKLNSSLCELSGIILIGRDNISHKFYSNAVETKEKIQEEKYEKEIYLTSVIESIPASVYWKNKEGIYLGCNSNAANLMGVADHNDIIGKKLEEIIPKDLANNNINIDDEVIITGIPKVLEEVNRRLDGSLGTYLTYKVPLNNKSGNRIGLLGVSFDITERKQFEQELSAAKQKAEKEVKRAIANLENVIACMPGSVYWKDINGVYQGCNDYFIKYCGFDSVEDIVGKKDEDFAKRLNWKLEVVESFRKVDIEVIKSGVPWLNYEEVPFKFIDGKQVNQLTNKVPLRDEDGNITGVVGISIDISNRKIMEQELREAKDRAEAANHSKSEFLAAVSHELRIPLTGILGMARILADEYMPDGQHKQVQDIIMSGEHLLALVNDLLDLAKLEAGKLELHPSPLNLRKLIEEIATMLHFQAKAKNIELLINYAPDAPQMIIGDARAIRQILLNLMGNAVKFTERGHVKVRVECASQQQLKAELLITVQDTGIGIPKEKANSVFERFNQVDSSRTRRYGGAGLGLTITKAYVELMGGRIWVESEVGKGSQFISQIPFPLQDMVNRPSVWDPYRSQLRVLVVDDTLRGDVIAKQLACAHCQVVPGPQAFNTILTAQQKREHYHIVIIDQQLQSLDAMELGRRINNQRNIEKPMMVLLMPPSTVEARNSAREHGFFETMIKPVHPSELLVGITAAWERWEDNNRVKNKSLSIFADKQPNILLVEDDPIIQKVHTMMLEKVGCKVSVAQNSQEALAIYANGHDAIFMDVGLPGMSGIEIAAEIRRREAGHGHIPIIGVTGYGYEEDRQNCLQAGMDDVAVKPLKPEELTQLLIKWVAKEQSIHAISN